MPEMKLKQQNLLYHFNSRIKSMETKLEIVQKLQSCASKSKQGGSNPGSLASTNLAENTEEQQHLNIKEDIKKVNHFYFFFFLI